MAEKERTSRRAGLGIGKRVGEMLLIFIIIVSAVAAVKTERERSSRGNIKVKMRRRPHL